MKRAYGLRPSQGGRFHPPVVPLIEHVTMSDAYQAFDDHPRELAVILRNEPKVDWSDAVPHKSLPVGDLERERARLIGKRARHCDDTGVSPADVFMILGVDRAGSEGRLWVSGRYPDGPCTYGIDRIVLLDAEAPKPLTFADLPIGARFAWADFTDKRERVKITFEYSGETIVGWAYKGAKCPSDPDSMARVVEVIQ